MDKLVELNREYWGRVQDMCEGTTVKSWECVKYEDKKYIGDTHPTFVCYTDKYKLAVAILKDDHTGEDRPVFVGDVLYLKGDGTSVSIIDRANNGNKQYARIRHTNGYEHDCYISESFITWHPPTPPRTFTINGVELPCPVKHRGQLTKTGIGISSTRKRFAVWFESKSQCDAVMDAIEKIITEARDK